MHNTEGTPSAPARRLTARRPLIWTYGSPRNPTSKNHHPGPDPMGPR